MYRLAHVWGIQPSEFWGMTPAEWFEIAEHYASKEGIAGTSITEERHAEIQSWAEKVKAERMAKRNGTS